MQLIYGGRRVRACSIELGWKTIPAVVLSLKSVLRGQHDENEFRKQFTPSERAAIAQAIEEELGNRQTQGRPKKVSANAETYPKGNTVDLAAKRAGFSSAETYERAKTVTEKGSPELVEAMDKGTVSISAAAAIASQPKQEQTRIIGLDKEEREAVVRRIRSTRADKEADERSAQDCYVFGGFYEALKLVGGFHVTAGEIWKGLARVHAYDASDHLARAIARLLELDKEHPNNPRRAELTVIKK
jgi:ParB-like chromosome segregation protein Spo0J